MEMGRQQRMHCLPSCLTRPSSPPLCPPWPNTVGGGGCHTACLWLQAHLSNEPQASRHHWPPCPGPEMICQNLPLLLLLQILSQWEAGELPEPSQETWGGGTTGT